MLSQYSDKNVIKLSSDDSVTAAIGAMEKNGIKEIVVMDQDKICLVDPHRILRLTTTPKTTKLKTIMFSSPVLSQSADLIEAIKLIVENGLDAIPIKEKGNVVGILSEATLMKELLQDKQFGNMAAEDVMTKGPILVKDTDTISTARKLMLDHNIEHLPVVDRSGKLVGILDEKNLLKAVLVDDEGFAPFNTKARKVSPWSAPIKDLLNPTPAVIHYKDVVRKALNDSNFNSAIVVVGEERKPVGIITPKDVLELVSIPKSGVYVQISGMQEEDGFDSKEAHAEVDRTVKKIGATLPIQRLMLHVKRYSEGGKIKYSIRTKLVTDSDVYVSHAWEWNLIRAVGSAMKMLEKQVFKKKGKKEDVKKHPKRKAPKSKSTSRKK